jgi:hypothetical protein
MVVDCLPLLLCPLLVACWLLQSQVHLLEHTPRHRHQLAIHGSHTNLDMNPSQAMRADHRTRLCHVGMEGAAAAAAV